MGKRDVIKHIPKNELERRVLVLPSNACLSSSMQCNFSIVSLLTPRGLSKMLSSEKFMSPLNLKQSTEFQHCLFLISDSFLNFHGSEGSHEPQCILQLVKYKAITGSWLFSPEEGIEESGDLISDENAWKYPLAEIDGSITMATPIDILFYSIPVLHNKQRTKQKNYTPKTDILDLDTEIFPLPLSHYVSDQQLALICDFKAIGGDLVVFRFNEEKASRWLIAKLNQVFHGMSKMSRNDALLSMFDYIDDHWMEKLEKYVTAIESKESTLSPDALYSTSDMFTASTDVPITDANGASKRKIKEANPDSKKPKTTGQRLREKVDKSGMKSLRSFFHKK